MPLSAPCRARSTRVRGCATRACRPRRAAAVPAWSRAAPHLMVALIDFDALGVPRGEAMRRMRGKGIGSQVHYIPVHRQPYYRQRYGDLALPGAEAWYARCLSLPLFPAMEDADVDRACEALAEALGLQP